MTVLLISFSARKSPGNCEVTLKYVERWLKGKGMDSSLIHMRDLEINPCLGCDYECCDPNASCSINDDVRFVYDKIFHSDMVIMAIPTYTTALTSRYFAWRERSIGVFTDQDQFNHFIEKVKGAIVFGNEKYGGNEAVNTIVRGSRGSTECLLIQSHQYDQSSIKGRLVDIPEVQTNLIDFLEKLLKKYDLKCSQ